VVERVKDFDKIVQHLASKGVEKKWIREIITNIHELSDKELHSNYSSFENFLESITYEGETISYPAYSVNCMVTGVIGGTGLSLAVWVEESA
jgi:hypothetical protein